MDEKIAKWIETIKEHLHLTEWQIKYEPKDYVDGVTSFSSKTIFLHFPENEPDIAIILHELCHAHCGVMRGVNTTPHDSLFAYLLTDLVRQFCIPKE